MKTGAGEGELEKVGTDRPIRFFIPGPSSRFFPYIREFLKPRGLHIDPQGRELHLRFPHLDVYLARGFDIPRLLGDGWGDLGITGIDAVVEARSRVKILCNLGIRWSRVVVASAKVQRVQDLPQDAVVVTEYPSLSAAYFADQGLRHLRQRFVSGAAECLAHLPEVDCIVTLQTSGQTLRANGLHILDTLLETEACLIKPDFPREVSRDSFEELVARLTQQQQEVES
jgi:ATP phosphoribosyltransferase